MQLPSAFTRRIETVFDPDGGPWLAALPALLTDLCRRWDVTLDPPFSSLSYNFVAPGTRADGQKVVLKVGVPRPELATEIGTLRHYAGRSAVRLLEADAALGALLLERLLPGRMLAELADDDAATRIGAELLPVLWSPPPGKHAFPRVDDWFRAFARHRAAHGGGAGPLPVGLLSRAEGVYAELRADPGPERLLHGDFHHYNILAATRSPWLAIDPKGIVGEAGFDVGAFLANPFERPPDRRRLARRLDIFAETLGISRARLARWGLAHALLSACWSVEDGEDPAWRLGVAEQLAAIMPG